MEDTNLNDVEIEPLGNQDLEEAAGGVYHPPCSWHHCSAPPTFEGNP